MDVHNLCQEYVNGHCTPEISKQIARGIDKGEVDLLKVVEALGVYLTSSNVDNRCLGTKLLTEVLTDLNLLSHRLPVEDVEYLVAFHCDRLKDRAIVLPHVITGIYAMVSNYRLSDENVVLVCRAVFKEVHNQSLQLSDRFLVYSIMEHFLTSHLKAVQAIGSEFVLGYLQAMDGEKDPKNLLTVFNSILIIIEQLPFDTLAEDLFEVTSCYFPIDFTPPPNDPNAISPESLVLALRKCLTATPKFVEFCLPLLLEKLSSDIFSAKLESLMTLDVGVGVFGAAKLDPFIDSIWSALRKEIFLSSSSEIQLACVRALASLVRALSTPLQVHSKGTDLLTSFIDKVLQDCQRHLNGLDLKSMGPAVHSLCAVARGSVLACARVVPAVVPLLIQQYHKASKETHCKSFLEAIQSLIIVVKDGSLPGEISPLAEHKDQLLDVLQLEVKKAQPVTTVIVIGIMKSLLLISGLLDPPQVKSCCDQLKVLTLNHVNATVRASSCSCLGVLSQLYPDLVMDTLLPPLVRIASDSHVDPSILGIMKIITAVSNHPNIVTITLPFLTGHLAVTLTSTESPLLWQVAQSVSSSILTVVSSNAGEETCRKLLEGKDGVLSSLVCLCVNTSTQSVEYDLVLKDLSSVVRCYTLAAADDAVLWLYQLLMKSIVLRERVNCAGDISLPRLDHNQPPNHTQLLCLVTSLVSAARQQVVVQNSMELLSVLLDVACHCTHNNSSQSAAKAYACILNKMEDSVAISTLLNKDLPLLWRWIEDNNSSIIQQLRALALWIWIAKALVTRSDPRGREMTLKLLELCGVASEHLRSEASDGFKQLFKDDEILTTLCHANIRLFYKQQLFMQIVPEIVQQFKLAEPGKQQYLLLSLSHCMQGVHQQVLITELPKLLPLLLESLSSEDVGLKVSTIQGLLSLIKDTPQSVVEHVPTLIPRLLTLARDNTSMKIRRAALLCIGPMVNLPTHVVYPYQGTVLRDLAPCLDDHKRLVRLDAVNARAKWFFLGT